MNFTQRVLSGVASVSLVAASVLGLGSAWGAAQAPLGAQAPQGLQASLLKTPAPATGSPWRTVSSDLLLSLHPADVVASSHHLAVAA